MPLPSRRAHNSEQSPMCYTVGPCSATFLFYSATQTGKQYGIRHKGTYLHNQPAWHFVKKAQTTMLPGTNLKATCWFQHYFLNGRTGQWLLLQILKFSYYLMRIRSPLYSVAAAISNSQQWGANFRKEHSSRCGLGCGTVARGLDLISVTMR